jgi:hypothetical protein
MFGVGYVSSLLLTSENALLLSSIAALLGGLATQNDTVIKQICWSRWVAEALYVSELRFDLLTGPLYDTAVYYIDFRAKFVTDNFATCIGALIIYGTVLRLWCFFLVWRKFKSTQ